MSGSAAPNVPINGWYSGGKTTTIQVVDSAAQITKVRILHYANGESGPIAKSSYDDVWPTSDSGSSDPIVIPSTMHGAEDIEISIYALNSNISNISIDWGDAAGYITGSLY